jgi:hypothetical protein
MFYPIARSCLDLGFFRFFFYVNTIFLKMRKRPELLLQANLLENLNLFLFPEQFELGSMQCSVSATAQFLHSLETLPQSLDFSPLLAVPLLERLNGKALFSNLRITLF